MWSHVILLLLTNEETEFLRGSATSPCLSAFGDKPVSKRKACGVHTPGDAPAALRSAGPTGQQALWAAGWPTTPAAQCGVSLRRERQVSTEATVLMFGLEVEFQERGEERVGKNMSTDIFFVRFFCQEAKDRSRVYALMEM